MTVDPSASLAKKFFTSREELVEALSSSSFYVELTFVVLAIVLAELTAFVVRKRVDAYVAAHPPKRIDVEFITKPFSLFSSIFLLMLLSIARSFAQQYAMSTTLSDAAFQLCLSVILAKIILLIVRSRPVAWFIAGVVMIVAVLDVTGFMASTISYLDARAFEIGKFKISMLNLTHGVIILVIVFWGAGMLSRTLESYLRRSSGLSYNARELTVKFFRIFIYFMALMITLSAVGVDLTAFAVFGGALGVGIGLGLQRVTANFVSGITLLLEKSIRLGDLIEVAGNTGHVRALNIRYALIETSDGRELLIPNEELTSTRVTNWTHSNDQARIEIRVTLDHETNAQKAIALMLETARAHPRCIEKPHPTCWLREFTEAGLLFGLTFWIADVHEGRNTPQSEVMLVILEKFREAGIKFGRVAK